MSLTRRLTRDRTDFKQITTLVVIGAVILAGIAGVAAFALSFRPSRFRLDPGHVLVYHATTTSTELAADNREGRPTTDERVLTLIGIAPDNQVALLAEEARGRDRISLHHVEPDGTMVQLDAAARAILGSRAVGILDFNLFALPPSASEQAWDTQISYGLLPVAKQLLQVRVRRSQSKSNPEFQLKPPAALEWIERGTYRQVKDLQATYRFRSSVNAVDKATIKCLWSVEQPDGKVARFRVVTEIELSDHDALDEDAQKLRAVAQACAAATEALSDPAIGPERRRELAANLRSAETAIGRLRQLADRLAVEVLKPAPAPTVGVTPAPGLRYQIQVAIGPEGQKAQAEQLVKTLIAGGFAARAEPAAAGNLRVVVGPFADKQPELLERLQRAFPYLKPLWVEAP
jgi:hypothetical protein